MSDERFLKMSWGFDPDTKNIKLSTVWFDSLDMGSSVKVNCCVDSSEYSLERVSLTVSATGQIPVREVNKEAILAVQETAYKQIIQKLTELTDFLDDLIHKFNYSAAKGITVASNGELDIVADIGQMDKEELRRRLEGKMLLNDYKVNLTTPDRSRRSSELIPDGYHGNLASYVNALTDTQLETILREAAASMERQQEQWNETIKDMITIDSLANLRENIGEDEQHG